MSDDIAIKVEGVSKTFHEQAGAKSIKEAFVGIGHKLTGKKENRIHKGDFKALKDINFEVKKGEFFGIVGRNGGGKSTLLKIIAGVYAPTKGVVQINGKLTPFIELGVGFNPELSGRDNVFLNAALLGFTRKQTEAMYKDIVEFAELEDFMDLKLKNYSSGMQVRLAFSVAIRAESDILLLDEVLAVGDAAFQQKCYNYFEELKRNKRTVVFVTHDMGAVKRFCTKAVYIKKGKLVQIGSPIDIADFYVAENIDSNIEDVEEKQNQSTASNVNVKILETSKDKIKFAISYDLKSNEESYIGISVVKDGTSVAEIITSEHMPLVGKGYVTYSLDTSIFNSGAYHFDAALFTLSNRELVAFNNKKCYFAIEESDITKGGAVKLAHTWEYK